MRTAYHKSMEPLLLLLCLNAIEKNDGFGDSLKHFLAFYREHRELFAALAGAAGAGSAPAAPPERSDGAASPEHKKASRPEEEHTGSLNVLEEYLRRAAAR